MLEMLHIENIAIIESAEIAFGSGFHALTGETGAGKSIVIDAMSAVLGQRTSRDLIRTGADKSFVSAWFTGIPADFCSDLGFAPDEDGNLMLQREIFMDGKNICRIGQRPATVSQLRAIGSRLLNIHGQHDGQQLLDEEQHLTYLDNFGRTENQLTAYGEKYKRFTDIKRQIAALQLDEGEKARRVDTLTYQIEELKRAKLKVGERDELAGRKELLRNSEKFISAVTEADFCLNGDEGVQGAVQALKQARDAIHGIRGLDDTYAQLCERLDAAYSEVYDIAYTITDARESFDFSPQELDRIEGRLDQLYRLAKKYGATEEEMLAYLAKCEKELASITDASDTLKLLERDLAGAEKELYAAAEELSLARRKAAELLAQQVLSELEQLDMGKIRFTVDFAQQAPDASGVDKVQFLMSANVGEALKPLHKIASGGELARIMLAMKNVLSEQDHVGTLVFDEVDTGVSGRAAQKVAEKMARIARKKQVLCVTHLPQLAAMADIHFSVEKGEQGGRTLTKVTELDRQARRQELARLTGGATVSDTQLQGAEELLAQADKFKETLA